MGFFHILNKDLIYIGVELTQQAKQSFKMHLNEFGLITPWFCFFIAIDSITYSIRNLLFLMLRKSILKSLLLYVGFPTLIKWLIYSYTKLTFYF